MNEYSFKCWRCKAENTYQMIPLEANAYINCKICDETIVLQVRNGIVVGTSLAEPFIPWSGSDEYLRKN